MWTYGDSRAALRDALRLSRAMTLKAACAGLPLGGGKGVIVLRPGDTAPSPDQRRAVLLDFGDTVDVLGGAYLTAEDVGTSEPDMRVISERTRFVTGLAEERGGSGDPSPWTALGCEAAARVTLERALGSPDLAGRRIAVQGLGHVGGRLAESFAAAGAQLIVSDVDPAKRAVAERLGAEWAEPEVALRADVDLLAPCALGAVLDHATVPELRCRAIAGAANNQLASDEIAPLLAERGILWAPDFVCNAGGIINIAVELEPEGYSPERADARVRAVAGTLGSIFDAAEADAVTPLEAALRLARDRLADAPPPEASRGARAA
jgi:leucine dehydrogenase